eukprot:Gb_17634 [translate_table: standard]
MESKPWIVWWNSIGLSMVRLSMNVAAVAVMKINHADAVQPLSPSHGNSTLPSMKTSPQRLPASQTQISPKEKFLVPVLSNYLGSNNQLVEYMSAAVIARATGRTLCLQPLFRGPLKHEGRTSMESRQRTIPLENRLDMKDLSKFVRVASMSRCVRECKKKVDAIWQLRDNRTSQVYGLSSAQSYKPKTIELEWSFVKWRSTADIARDLRDMDSNCAAITGLFPGHGWRGAFLGVSAYLKPSSCIADAVSALHIRAFGSLQSAFLASKHSVIPYLAVHKENNHEVPQRVLKPSRKVHWRFEESNCRGHDLGLCFVRCGDGSIVSSGLRSAARRDWNKQAKKCSSESKYRGVVVKKQDIINAILEKAREQNVSNVYLATDGWIRGSHEQILVAEVVIALRGEGMNVAGLWKIRVIPNFSDGAYFNPLTAVTELGLVNSCKMKPYLLSFIEQEMCVRGKVFLGSGESTWSLTVFYKRLATRKAAEVIRSRKQNFYSKVHDIVSDALLSDQHASGLMCRYWSFYNQREANYTVETFKDEQPDGWLDLEACEKRIAKGGQCQLAACI